MKYKQTKYGAGYCELCGDINNFFLVDIHNDLICERCGKDSFVVYVKPKSKQEIIKLGLKKHLENYSITDIKKLFWATWNMYDGTPKIVSSSKIPNDARVAEINIGEADGDGRYISSIPYKRAYRKGNKAYVPVRTFDVINGFI